MLSDGKSSLCLWQGELKSINVSNSIQNTEVVCTHICDRHTRCFHLLPCCFLDDDDDDNNKTLKEQNPW